METNDLKLTAEHIGQLESTDQLIHFFAQLGYDTDDAIALDHTALNLDVDDLRQQIRHIHRLASDADQELVVYFFHVRSVTQALTQAIARRFRERTEEALLVLTANYETLDFVLLDREIEKGTARGKSLRQVIRPRFLTVNRRNPGAVARRVLQRFTFTEADGIYQWDKLRAAYSVAEWTEPEFNNRALFSDYYLKNRLTDDKLTPAWKEDVKPIGRKVHQHLSQARQRYSQKPEQVVREGLYEPIFRELGFELEVQKAGTADTATADYKLYTPGDRAKPVALALTYVWNRNLDNEDTTRDPDTATEIPGALVVSVLENTDVPWVIVTNGKLWRLYSATASNKATNYYEVDLEEALAAPEQVTALKYWWLFFRHDAFTGFLAHLLQQSADYAKGLGDRLKDRVFTEIFPHFAAGFIQDIRADIGKDNADFDGDALQQVYEGTLTFLYRLMFVLYAESLELLPLYETHGYRQLSLYEMKWEIKGKAGDIGDEAPNKLKKAYSPSSTALYERLNKLFAVIDTGSDDLNLPTYNGGLFSQTNDNGEFLADYAIPDRYLVLGLDKLCRDVDDKTHALVFIDYKSLGVRQLGSIYEGLLEFTLRIAQEKLAVIKEKGKEVYVPLAQAGKQRVQTTLEKDAAYLENDKRERKATGSYYTPDYIVKYIVENTVGPVLARKFTALGPQLREAQKQYRDHAKVVKARNHPNETPEKFWNGEALRHLADECLNVRVLDPAMGSGHFLVEVVDYVSNRLIDFLNGWSENPVWALLNRTREDILVDMERQGVTIDADKLTRVALLKRAVLKRCVYGVDLNGMAVELAKVSLWLDAFTLGAPLSFLDHHLKQGNSLIGARVAEVQAALKGQQTLFSQNKFAGVMLATDLMRQVSYLSDNTVEQARQSAQAYRDAGDHLAPYKRVLDVYTSRWFGNEPGKTKKGPTFDPTVEFLQREDTQAWIENPKAAKLPHNDYMNTAQVALTAIQAAEEKLFFHWELEFPELFFAPSKPGGQDVDLLKDGGFDVVVGNPPYVNVVELEDYLRAYILLVYKFAEGRVDIYLPFMEKSLELLKPKGRTSFIVPNKWYVYGYGKTARKTLLTDYKWISAVDLSLAPSIFGDASTYSQVSIFEKDLPYVAIPHEINVYRFVADSPEYILDLEIAINKRIVEYDSVDRTRFIALPESVFAPRYLGKMIDITTKCYQDKIIIGDLFDIEQLIRIGSASARARFVLEANSVNKLPTNARRIIDADELSKWEIDWVGRYLIYNPSELYNPKTPEIFENPKIFIKDTSKRLIVVPDVGQSDLGQTDKWFYALNTVYGLIPRGENAKLILFVAACLNSTLLDALYKTIFGALTIGGGYIRFREYLQFMPIPPIKFTIPTAERKRLVRAVIGEYTSGDNVGVVHRAQAALNAGQSDVVHDLLAYFAQCMMDLNKDKQAEIKRFLGWLEGKLKIGAGGIDSLNGKTIIQGYLGDYQKDEPERSWDDFYYRLHQNRNRLRINLAQVKAEIQHAYEKSLATLRPIKQQLAATDALIDQIVYKLYGLTDEEIELIERPAYEQALTEAKAKVLKDEKLQKDPDAALEVIAEGVLPAAKRLQSRIPQQEERARLDQDLPGWHLLPGDVPTFLLTGEYNIATQPEYLDFSTSVIAYAKAVETALYTRLFLTFRAESSYSDADCHNKFLQQFMRGEKHLTLGSFPIIMGSSKETALRQFAATRFQDAENSLFGESGVSGLLNDATTITLRNKAAHDEVLTRPDAQQTRDWALAILHHL